MAKSYSYACADYPGMENCPGKVTTETEAELWQLMETHARIAHGEDPSGWSDEDRKYLATLIRED